jgi:flagellar basal body-associated protein FliL
MAPCRNYLAAALVSVAFVLFARLAQTQPSSSGTPEPEANPKPSVEELAKLKQNPVSGLRQVLIQAEISFAVSVRSLEGGQK